MRIYAWEMHDGEQWQLLLKTDSKASAMDMEPAKGLRLVEYNTNRRPTMRVLFDGEGFVHGEGGERNGGEGS